MRGVQLARQVVIGALAALVVAILAWPVHSMGGGAVGVVGAFVAPALLATVLSGPAKQMAHFFAIGLAAAAVVGIMAGVLGGYEGDHNVEVRTGVGIAMLMLGSAGVVIVSFPLMVARDMGLLR